MTDLHDIYIEQVKADLYAQIKALQERIVILEEKIKQLKSEPEIFTPV